MQGFRDLSPTERRERITAEVGADGLDVLDARSGLSVDDADHLIENVVGVWGVPVGIATNFCVNGRDVLVPMATEEASVVAAASNAARMTRPDGGFHTSSSAPLMQAQIQILDCPDPQAARLRILAHRDEVLELADAQDPQLVELGGGARDLIVRIVHARDAVYVVVHLVVDVRDAMGANAVNTMAEAVADLVAGVAGGRHLLRILTNMADLRTSRAWATFDADLLGGPEVVADVLHAAALAEADPYRATTHNKGIMNGITAVVLATGNDTRAVESGAHSHAIGPDGRYTSLTHFEADADGNLVGSLEVPMAVGLVGGATRSHPVARAALSILGVSHARELGEIIVAAGLAQNLAALRALATEGIQRGHMALHARSIAIAAGASGDELTAVVGQMIAEQAVGPRRATELLTELRAR